MVKRWHLLLGLGVLIGAAVTYVAVQGGAIAQERAVVSFTPQERATLTSLESALTRIAETVQPTVVHIRATRQLAARPRDGWKSSCSSLDAGGFKSRSRAWRVRVRA